MSMAATAPEPERTDDREWLRAGSASPPLGVDRDSNVINGYVVAELGPFKSAGRGEFSQESLERIVKLGNASLAGLKSRFTHPDLSNDGLGTFLGRARNFRLDKGKVRANLHLDKTALETPPRGGKPLGTYVMDLAESDPGALSSSLVLQAEKIYTLDENGRRKKNDKGEEIPPVWLPTRLHASDVVDTGDAVNDFLSADIDVEGLADVDVRRAAYLLDQKFAGQPREIVAERCTAFVNRYLSRRFGDEEMSQTAQLTSVAAELKTFDPKPDPEVVALREQVKSLTATMADFLKSTKEDREATKSEQAKLKRSQEIAALCQMAGSSDAATFIANESLSVDQVRAQLFEKLCQSRELPKSEGGGDGNQDLNAKYKAEYAQRKDVHAKLGISEEAYIKQRRIEDKLDAQPDLMQLAVERSQKKTAA